MLEFSCSVPAVTGRGFLEVNFFDYSNSLFLVIRGYTGSVYEKKPKIGIKALGTKILTRDRY